MAAEKGVQITTELATEPPLMVWADRDRIMQVLLNLLSNAVKFCPAEDGRVLIAAARQGRWLVVRVTDNGQGITSEDQKVIFDKFRQGGDRRQGRPQGTGLGLPISAQIIDHFGGKLWVESTPGEGATFAFTLPLPADDKR
jgi:signal transduction histidine kinase